MLLSDTGARPSIGYLLTLTSYPAGDRTNELQLAAFRNAITEAFQAGNGGLEVDKERELFISQKAD